jgi:hypothetical protein
VITILRYACLPITVPVCLALCLMALPFAMLQMHGVVNVFLTIALHIFTLGEGITK